VSIHPDDDFNLKAALASELSDVVPSDGLARKIIARHRAVRRRRVAGAAGLVAVLAGIGVPLGLDAAHPGHASLRLAPYTLELPGHYHQVAVSSASCGPGRPVAGQGRGPGAMAAAVGSGACLVLLLTSPFSSGLRGDPNLPRNARPVELGHDRGWLIPHGYWQPAGTTVVIERAEPGGRLQDLIVTSTGLSPSAMVSLVSAGLS